MFFLEFFENFQNSYVKGQSFFRAVGTIEERDGLLKNLIRSALSLVTHDICKFKTFYSRCSDTEKTSKMRKVSFMLKINSTIDNRFLFLPF